MIVSASIVEKSRMLRQSRFLRFRFAVPAVIIGLVLFAALFANWLTPHDPSAGELTKRLMPPFWQSGGSPSYPLGTDPLGQDILSRIILGARVSIIVALAAISLGGGIGTALGLISGYFGGKLDMVIMRVVDGMLTFPMIFLALFLAATLGPGLSNLVFVISLVLWSRFARVVRAEVLSWKTRDFVALAKIAGASHIRMMVHHILPNILNTVVVLATLQVGMVIILESSLSFLGVGVPPPTPAWGSMLAGGREYITTAWWLCVFPGLAILFTVLALNLLGDWLRDTLDPRMRQM